MSENEWPRAPFRKINGGAEIIGGKALAEKELQAAYDTLATLTAALKAAREGLEKANRTVKILADGVYNDNGDMTVEKPLLTYDQCCNAYFAEKAVDAAIAQADAALAKVEGR
jgi:hypothetical protein